MLHVIGTPCLLGHVLRYARGGACVPCAREYARALKARRKAERAKWPRPPRVPRPLLGGAKQKRRKRTPEQLAREREHEKRKYADPVFAAEYRRRKAEWGRAHKAKRAAWASARRASVLQRTPAWADADAIRAVYERCGQVTRESGVPHEVDHYYPLQGKSVSGLHVHENLQIIPARINRRKHAIHPEDFTLAA